MAQLKEGARVCINQDGRRVVATVVESRGDMVEFEVEGSSEHLFMQIEEDGRGKFRQKPGTRSVKMTTI